jgi:hypothetical protein
MPKCESEAMQRKGKMRGFDVYKAVAVEKERCSDWTMDSQCCRDFRLVTMRF